jgi:hypothetical protein
LRDLGIGLDQIEADAATIWQEQELAAKPVTSGWLGCGESSPTAHRRFSIAIFHRVWVMHDRIGRSRRLNCRHKLW